jgi:hypothetical protein
MLVKNANRTQNLMTGTIAKTLPPLYAQDGKGDAAIAYVKFFHPMTRMTWYATEFSPERMEFFGLVVTPDCPDGSFGYFSLTEMAEVLIRPGVAMERDAHFKPTPIGECRPGN